MNAEQWKEYGYVTLFDCGNVYLYRPGIEVGYTMAINGGEWMRHRNLNAGPWRFISYARHPDLRARFRHLYSYSSAQAA